MTTRPAELAARIVSALVYMKPYEVAGLKPPAKITHCEAASEYVAIGLDDGTRWRIEVQQTRAIVPGKASGVPGTLEVTAEPPVHEHTWALLDSQQETTDAPAFSVLTAVVPKKRTLVLLRCSGCLQYMVQALAGHWKTGKLAGLASGIPDDPP